MIYKINCPNPLYNKRNFTITKTNNKMIYVKFLDNKSPLRSIFKLSDLDNKIISIKESSPQIEFNFGEQNVI